MFTIDFSFEEKAAKALVCMYEKGYNILFKIHVYNKEFHPLIPSGNLEFSFIEGLKEPQRFTDFKGQQLATCIANEISAYLATEKQNRW